MTETIHPGRQQKNGVSFAKRFVHYGSKAFPQQCGKPHWNARSEGKGNLSARLHLAV